MSRFVYVTYIRTTPEKLWEALTQPEFTRQYWASTWQESDWTPGSSWRAMIPDGRVADAGEIIEVDRPRRLVMTMRAGDSAYSRLAIDIAPVDGGCELTLTHKISRDYAEYEDHTRSGWTKLLGDLKRLLGG